MKNYEKFIEIFGDTGEEVKASKEWLGKEYTGPVPMTEREKFLEWLDEQPFIRHKEYDSGGDAVYIYRDNDDEVPIVRVSDFDKAPDKVYVRIDGFCGVKPLIEVKEIIRKASRDRVDQVCSFYCLCKSLLGR